MAPAVVIRILPPEQSRRAISVAEESRRRSGRAGSSGNGPRVGDEPLPAKEKQATLTPD
jgi:hypothetical protein